MLNVVLNDKRLILEKPASERPMLLRLPPETDPRLLAVEQQDAELNRREARLKEARLPVFWLHRDESMHSLQSICSRKDCNGCCDVLKGKQLITCAV